MLDNSYSRALRKTTSTMNTLSVLQSQVGLWFEKLFERNYSSFWCFLGVASRGMVWKYLELILVSSRKKLVKRIGNILHVHANKLLFCCVVKCAPFLSLGREDGYTGGSTLTVLCCNYNSGGATGPVFTGPLFDHKD